MHLHVFRIGLHALMFTKQTPHGKGTDPKSTFFTLKHLKYFYTTSHILAAVYFMASGGFPLVPAVMAASAWEYAAIWVFSVSPEDT